MKTHPERIIKLDRQMVNDFDYGDIKLPVSKRDYSNIDKKNNICINVFGYNKNVLVYPVHVSNKKHLPCSLAYKTKCTDD